MVFAAKVLAAVALAVVRGLVRFDLLFVTDRDRSSSKQIGNSRRTPVKGLFEPDGGECCGFGYPRVSPREIKRTLFIRKPFGVIIELELVGGSGATRNCGSERAAVCGSTDNLCDGATVRRRVAKHGRAVEFDDLDELRLPSSQFAREHEVPVRSVRIDGNGLETDAHLWTGARPTGV